MNKLFKLFQKLFQKRKQPKGFIEVTYDGATQKILVCVSSIAMVDYSIMTRQAIISMNGTQYFEKNEYNPDCSVWYNKIYANESYETIIELIKEAQK